MTHRLSYEIITTESGLVALREAWERLSASSRWPNPFTGYGWTRACFAEHRSESTLWIVVARNADEIVGIAPLMTARRDDAEVLVFIADTRGDYLGFLATSPPVEHALWQEILRRRGGRRVILCNLVDETATLHRAHGAVHINDAFRCVPSDGRTVPSWLRVAARKRRRWVDAGGVIERHTGARAASFIPEIAQVEAASWKGAAGILRFASPAQQAFLRTAFIECPEVELWVARHNHTIAAYDVGFRPPRGVWFYQGAYLPRFARFTPGNILSLAAIDHAMQDRGPVEYDFLSGREPYKALRTNARRPMYRIVAS